MSFEEDIKKFAKEIPEKIEHIDSEETTKIALILPFLRLMGYDTSDPSEVKAEYTADIGTKKGEKIDIAILNNGKPEMLIECKPAFNELAESHISQLYRYFNVTGSKIGVLTNGIVYKFFTDTKKPGMMDDSPFLEFNLNDLQNRDIKEMIKFTKENYNLDNILSYVNIMKYSHDIKKSLVEEMENPSDEFVKVIAKNVYDGVLTKKPKDMFRAIITNVFKEIINEKVEKRLTNAIEKDDDVKSPILINEEEINTSNEELEAFYIIKSIVSEITDNNRVALRDRKSYCGILLDNNQYYPICRLYFNNKDSLKVALFDKFEKAESGRKIDEKVTINEVNEIYKYKDRILKTVNEYDKIKNSGKK